MSELRDKLADLVEEHFPKGECKERGQAMVLIAYAEMLFKAEQKALLGRLKEQAVKATGYYKVNPEDDYTTYYTQAVPISVLDNALGLLSECTDERTIDSSERKPSAAMEEMK